MIKTHEQLIRKLIRTLFLVVFVFIILKSFRPQILSWSDNNILKTFLYSFPNLAEAVSGVLILTCILLYFFRILNNRKSPQDLILYLCAALLAGIYVITQELKIHNLGGKNIYDPNDLVFSIIGIVTGFCLVLIISNSKITNYFQNS